MKTMIVLLAGAILVLTAFNYIWLWFMIRHPQKWANWVDKENDFWVCMGMVSGRFADRMKQLEKGFPLKLLVGTGAFMGTAILINFAFLVLKFDLLSS